LRNSAVSYVSPRKGRHKWRCGFQKNLKKSLLFFLDIINEWRLIIIVTEKFTVKVGPPWLTRFEKSRILSARALQITLGAPILIDIPPEVRDPVAVARLELDSGILPITIRRRLPDGAYQDIPVKFLMEQGTEEKIEEK